MFLQRLKENKKSLLAWCLVFIGLFILIFVIYPSIIQKSDDLINQVITMFPQEVLDAFNITSLATPSGWITSEGMIILLLCGSIYSTILGASCVFAEKKNKTIEFLASKPVTRNNILIKKSLADILCISVFTIINCVTIVVGLAFSNDLDLAIMLKITLSPILVYLTFYFLSLLISILYKGRFGFSLGIPLIFYLIVILTKLSTDIAFLKYFSPYIFSDTTEILHTGSLSWISVIVALFICISLAIASLKAYNTKELL